MSVPQVHTTVLSCASTSLAATPVIATLVMLYSSMACHVQVIIYNVYMYSKHFVCKTNKCMSKYVFKLMCHHNSKTIYFTWLIFQIKMSVAHLGMVGVLSCVLTWLDTTRVTVNMDTPWILMDTLVLVRSKH